MHILQKLDRMGAVDIADVWVVNFSLSTICPFSGPKNAPVHRNLIKEFSKLKTGLLRRDSPGMTQKNKMEI